MVGFGDSNTIAYSQTGTGVTSVGNTNTLSNGSTLSTGDTSTTGTTSTLSTGQSETSSTTTNSSDPAAIAALRALVGYATGQAENPLTATKNLVAGIYQSAKDSFASVLGSQAGSGLYNSASAQVQGQDSIARATADSAQAVLSYSTGEQSQAESGLNELISALGTVSSQGSSTTSNQSIAVSDTNTTSQNKGTSTDNTVTNSGTTTNTKTSGFADSNTGTIGATSAVCTLMVEKGMLEKRKYAVVHRHYESRYPWWARQAYLHYAQQIIIGVNKNAVSRRSKFFLELFRLRTDYVCWTSGYKLYVSPRTVVLGFLAKKAVSICCFPLAVGLLVKSIFTGKKG